jgi:hypothetical protein
MGSVSAVEPAIRSEEFCQILGGRFFVGGAQRAIELLAKGGLLVVPDAPALKNLPHDDGYREALLQADVAIADSSLMVTVWNLIQKDSIRRLSGLEYLPQGARSQKLRQPRNRDLGRRPTARPAGSTAATATTPKSGSISARNLPFA